MFIRSSSTTARYLFTFTLVALATLLRAALTPLLGTGVPFILYYPTVALCAWFGGLGQGIVATGLSCLIAWYAFVPPYRTLLLPAPAQLLFFLLSSGVISLLTGRLHRARRVAEESEAREGKRREEWQVTLASIGDAVITTDKHGTIRFMNPVAEQLTGWTQAEALGRPLNEVFHIVNEETRQAVENPVAKVIRVGQSVGLANHTVLLAKDGIERPIDDSSAPIKDETGATLGAVLVFRDITERRRAEREQDEALARERAAHAAVEVAQHRMSAILESIQDGFYTLDHAWRYTYVNRRTEELARYDREYLLGKSVWEVFPESVLQKDYLEFQRAMREQTRVSFENFYQPYGIWYETEAYPTPEGLSVFVRDITERKQAEERLTKAFKASPNALAISRLSDGMIFEVNDSWCALFGYARAEAVGHTSLALKLFPDPEAHARISAGLRERGSVQDEEIVVRNKAGQERLLLLFIEQLEINGELCMITASQDVTEQRHLEKALRDSEAKFATAFNQSPLALIITSLEDGRLVEVNEGFLQLSGYTRAEALGRSPDELGLWLEPAQRAERFAQLQAGGSVPDIEAHFRTKAGETLVGVIASTRVEINGRPCVLSSITNITELSRTTEALRASEERLRLVHQATRIGLWEWNQATNEVYWSDEYREIYGLGAGAPSFESGMAPVLEQDRAYVLQTLGQAIEQNQEFKTEHRIHHPQKGLRWLQSLGRVISAAGEKPLRVAGLVMDITEKKQFEQEREQLLVREQIARAQAEAAERQAAFLAQASELLASSLDYETTLKGVAHLAVPRFGDWCAVDIVGEDRLLRRVAVEHPDAAMLTLAEEVHRRYPPSLADPGGVPQVLRTGQPVLYPEVTDEMLVQGVQDAEQLRLLRALDLKSVMIVPLSARGRTLGAITFVTGGTRRRYTADDLSFAQDLARRAALAVDNARLYHEAQAALREREQALALHQEIDQQLSTLVEASKTLLGSMQLDEVQQAVLRLAKRLIAADAYALWQQDQPGAAWRVVAATGLSEAFQTTVLHANNFSLSRLEKALAVEAVKTTPWLQHRQAAYQSEGIESFLAIPLTRQEDFNATITFYYRQPHQFTELETRVATALASLSATALSNVELYQEQHQLRVRAEEADRLKDEFLATVSHELRAPLNSVLGYTRLILTNPFEPAMVRRNGLIIERNARMQQQLIEDLLDTARIVSGKLKIETLAVDLRLVLEDALEVVRPAAEARQIALIAKLGDQPQQIMGDPARLQQVAWNLLQNAIKFTPVGGRVELSLAQVEQEIHLHVSDTGKGIEPEFLPRIFDRFSQRDMSRTRRHGGLGLGLALTKQLVELHGGRIEAVSGGVGQGTTFTVALPLRAPLSTPMKSQVLISSRSDLEDLSLDDLPRLDGVRLLVVDDEEDVRRLLAETLGKWGATVTVATNGLEAERQLLQASFDVLICDVAMPELDGYQVLERLRVRESQPTSRTQKPLPAIALTARARSEDRLQAFRAGFQMHVAKPVELAELVMVIASLLQKSLPTQVEGDSSLIP